MDPLSGATSVIAVVELAKEVGGLCVEYASAVAHAKEEIERLEKEVNAIERVLNEVASLPKTQAVANILEHPVEQCRATLSKLRDRLESGREARRDGVMKKFGIRSFKWPFKRGEVNEEIEILERRKSTLSVALNTDIKTALNDQLLSQLPDANGAAYNSKKWQHESQCLSGTRVEIQRDIRAWGEDAHGEAIYWLSGVAGTSKSTIARTVAATWDDDDENSRMLGASFFFSRGGGDLGHAEKSFTTIALQLVYALPALKPAVITAIIENPKISERGLAEQWTHLILKPLSTVQLPRPVVIVIDALDECHGEEDIRLILRLLPQVGGLPNVRVRFFITSRPETPIRLGFYKDIPGTHRDFRLHEVPLDIITKDISLYLHHRLTEIQKNACMWVTRRMARRRYYTPSLPEG